MTLLCTRFINHHAGFLTVLFLQLVVQHRHFVHLAGVDRVRGMVMLRLMMALSALCVGSAAMGLGKVVQLPATTSGLCLAVFALSGTLLIGSFEAYETEASRVVERDDT